MSVQSKQTISLRTADSSDIQLIFDWRNNPLVYHGLYTQHMENRPLSWAEHVIWWNSRQNWQRFIVQLVEMDDIGYVYISQLDHWSPEIAYVIGEVSLWGRGYGKKAVELALDWLRENGYGYTHTTVLDDNERGKGIVKSLGFECRGEARPGESWWMKKL